MLNTPETFMRSATLIQRTDTLLRAFEAASKSQRNASLVRLGSEIRDLRGGKSVPHLILNRRENFKMTKTTKAMLAGAAFAGLIAGSGAAVKASTLLPSLKTSFSAQEQSQDQGKDKKDDKQVKEKHACKGQNSCKGKGGCKSSDNGCKGENSCKGKGGCATDGSKKPQ
jgi:hypothetical protein